MSSETPTYQDADLLLRVYELRRETLMRTSRDAINGFWPKSYDDVKAYSAPGHPVNAAWRQVTSYWEMVFGMAHHGIVATDFWIENNGEGLFLFAKIAPYLDEIRADGSPRSFLHLEWAATQTDMGKQYFEMLQGFVQRRLAAK